MENNSTDAATLNQKYNGIDLIKFIMAIFIVMMHSNFMLDISYNINYAFKWGITRIAVPFFFIASGFLLYRKIDICDIDIKKIKKYIKHICRLYIAWTIIYLPIIVYDLLKSDKGILSATSGFIINSIMAVSYLHLWFLQALIVSVLLVTLFLYLKFSVKKIFFIALLLYCVGLLGQGYYWIFDYFFPEGSSIYNIFKILEKIFVTPRNGFCFGFLFFFMGVYISASDKVVKQDKLIFYTAVSFILFIMEVMLGSFYGFNKSSDVYIMLIPLAYFVFLYSKNLRLRDSKKLIYLRKQSMYIYFIHPWFLFIVGRFFGCSKYSLINLGHFVIFVIVLTLSILFSHIIIKLIQNGKYKYFKYLS